MANVNSSLSIRYITKAHNFAKLTASLVPAIKSSKMQVLGHAKHDLRWAIRVGSSAELWNMFAIVMKEFANKVLTDCGPTCPRRTQNINSTSFRREVVRTNSMVEYSPKCLVIHLLNSL